MQGSSTTPVAKKEEFLYPSTEKGKLYLSIGLQREIEWLHKQVGPKEWCGVLFYKRLEGDIDNPKELKLRAEKIYPMDIGRETYTEADFDADSTIDQWKVVEGADGEVDYSTWKRGLIHTHHNMTTFFSGTDLQELHDNAPTHNYYLSLIVNFSGVYTARVAFVAKRQIIMNYTSVQDEAKEIISEKELLMMIEMDIVKETEEVVVPDFFRSRFEGLKTEAEERTAAILARATTTTTPYTGGGVRGFRAKDDEDDWEGIGQISGPSSKPDLQRNLFIGGKNPTVVTNQGNLEKDGKTFKPIAKVELAITEQILDWLNDGLAICSEMNQEAYFNSIPDALDYYTEFFKFGKEIDVDLYEYFKDRLQANMESKFKKWYVALVQRMGMEALDILIINNPIAGDIYDMFESYPQFLVEMSHVNKSKEKEKVSSKQRTKVNARRQQR